MKQDIKSGQISAPDCPSKGQRGVRQHFSTDESKMLSVLRAGKANIKQTVRFINVAVDSIGL